MAHRSFSVRRFCRLGALMLLLFGLPRGAAAQGDDPGFVNWTDSVGFFFDSLAVSDVPSGILYERMIPFGPAPFLFGAQAPETPLDTATRQTLRQTYARMYSGVQNANIQLAPPDSFFGAYFAGPDTFDYRPLAFFHHNFHAIRDSAFADSALVLSADSTYFTRGDTSAPEPFGEVWAAVAAPVYETVPRGPVNWRLPSELFFTAYPSPVSQIRFDPGDGGGFRTAELDADVAADYTEADEHENIVMVLEVTYADGALWQMLLRVVPADLPAAVPAALTNAGYEKSDFKVTRDPGEPLRRPRPPLFAGRAGDHADMRVLYRCKEQGLRKPLILVEGFDPKDEENSQERLEHILDASDDDPQPRLALLFDEGEYDIVYIRFRNQWDYIENMGQLLQEALEWINLEKAAAGSQQPNVVWGFSMGGLVAKYCLAYMENDPAAVYRDHEVSQLITYDSPLRGANVPLGLQFMVEHLNEIDFGIQNPFNSNFIVHLTPESLDEDLPKMKDMLSWLSVRQMLIHSKWNTDYTYRRGGGSEHHVSPHQSNPSADLHRELLVKLDQLSAPGFTFEFRAVSNGSEIGEPLPFAPGEKYMTVFFNQNYIPWWVDLISLSLGKFTGGSGLKVATTGSLNVYGAKVSQHYDDRYRIYGGGIGLSIQLRLTAIIIPINITVLRGLTVKTWNPPAIDNAPGGAFRPAELGVDLDDVDIEGGEMFFSPNNLQGDFSFVPTYSALDIPLADLHARHYPDTTKLPHKSLQTDMQPGNALRAPHLTNYYASQYPVGDPLANQTHLEFTDETLDFMEEALGISDVMQRNAFYEYVLLIIAPYQDQTHFNYSHRTRSTVPDVQVGRIDPNTEGFLYFNNDIASGFPLWFEPAPDPNRHKSAFMKSELCDGPSEIDVYGGGNMIVGAPGGANGRTATLNVPKGAEVNLLHLDSYGEINTGSEIIVRDGGLLHLYSNSEFVVKAGAVLVIKDGGTLRVEDAAMMRVEGDGRIVIEDGGRLEIIQQPVIELAASDSELEIAGTLDLTINSIFEIDGTSSGFVHFNSPGFNPQSIEASTGAEIRLSGSGSADEVLRVSQETLNLPPQLAAVTINDALATLGPGARVQLEGQNTTFSFTNAMLDATSGALHPTNPHRGLVLFGQNPANLTIDNASFWRGAVGLQANNLTGGHDLELDNCQFYENQTAVRVVNKGATVTNCYFEDNNNDLDLDVDRASLVEDCDFVSGGLNIDIDGVNSPTVTVRNCDMEAGPIVGTCIKNYDAVLIPECTNFLRYAYGLDVSSNGTLDMDDDNGNSFDDIDECAHIYMYYPLAIEMKDGACRFADNTSHPTLGYYSFKGTLYYGAPNYSCAIDARNNIWQGSCATHDLDCHGSSTISVLCSAIGGLSLNEDCTSGGQGPPGDRVMPSQNPFGPTVARMREKLDRPDNGLSALQTEATRARVQAMTGRPDKAVDQLKVLIDANMERHIAAPGNPAEVWTAYVYLLQAHNLLVHSPKFPAAEKESALQTVLSYIDAALADPETPARLKASFYVSRGGALELHERYAEAQADYATAAALPEIDERLGGYAASRRCRVEALAAYAAGQLTTDEYIARLDQPACRYDARPGEQDFEPGDEPGAESSAEQLTVYPNPSDGVYTLTYDLQAEGAEIVVRNVVGATVWQGAAEGRQGQTTIDLISAAAGVYVCNVFSGGALIRSVKLVKR